MREEILRARGRLAGYKKNAEDLELKIAGLILLIRNYIDPYEKKELLRAKEASNACAELVERQQEYIRIQKKIEELEYGIH